jgi:hypothetical protein
MTTQTFKQRLLGAWRSTGYQAVREDGNVIHPMGEALLGYILYTHDGYMTATLMRPGRASFALADLTLASIEELAPAARSYFSYGGPYHVDEASGIVTHRVEISLLPNWIGIEQKRKILFDGDRLELRGLAPAMFAGEMRTARVFWQRA